MREYLKNISSRLKNYSQSLDKKSILLEKPWTMIDDDMEQQKLIFKKNHELIISKNGEVQVGKWEYFSEAKSLLIDRGKDKLLCNEAFVDENVLILRLDGTNNRFFALANENQLPELDIYNYLKKLRHEKDNIQEVKLDSGKTIEIARSIEWDIVSGDLVTMNDEPIEDGAYSDQNSDIVFYVENSQIEGVYYKSMYTNTHNQTFTFHKRIEDYLSLNDYIYYMDKIIAKAIIDYDGNKTLFVKDSRVTKIKRRLPPAILRPFKKPKKFNYYIKLAE